MIYTSPCLINLTNTNSKTASSSSGSKQGPALSGTAQFLGGWFGRHDGVGLDVSVDLPGTISGKLATASGKKGYRDYTDGRVDGQGWRCESRTRVWRQRYWVPCRNEGIKFGTVGLLENLFPRNEMPRKERRPCASQNAFGGLGGVMAGLITYPNDTVRRLLQGSRGTQHAFTSYWIVSANVQRAHGIARFYRSQPLTLFAWHPMRPCICSYELKQWTANI
jgi:solute carrier family 25 phosphate transporter 23/24/25/41